MAFHALTFIAPGPCYMLETDVSNTGVLPSWSFIPERKGGDTPHFIISETSKVQEEIEGGQGDRDRQDR